MPRRAAALCAAVLLLAGCTAAPEPAPSPTEPPAAEQCGAAVAGVVAAVESIVSTYDQPLGVDGTPTAPPELPATGSSTGDRLADAVATARDVRQRVACDDFEQRLADGLASVEPEATIARAIWRRLGSSLLGTIRQDTGDWALQAGQDLARAVADAPDGGTVVLPEGTIDLGETLVLLDGLTLRGAGRDATTLRVTAYDAAILIAASALVALADLTVEVTDAHPASVVVAGPWAKLSLSGVRFTGATVVDGVGGAGVYLSAGSDEFAADETTLEVTDAIFERNAWAGLAVTGRHRVSIESAQFIDNGDVGLLFVDDTSGSVRGAVFRGNAVGLAVSGHATPSLLDSAASGGSVAVQTDAAAAPVVEGLTITGSSTAAMLLGGESAGWIGGVECSDVPFGIVVSSGAAPTLGTNTCPLTRGPN